MVRDRADAEEASLPGNTMARGPFALAVNHGEGDIDDSGRFCDRSAVEDWQAVVVEAGVQVLITDRQSSFDGCDRTRLTLLARPRGQARLHRKDPRVTSGRATGASSYSRSGCT